jgi:transposase
METSQETPMANRLGMAKINAILVLHRQGWSQRRIARTLGVDRKTVADHLCEDSKGAKAPTGEAPPADESKGAKAPTGSEPVQANELPLPGRSDCERYRDLILPMLESGLSAKRIYQDLAGEHGFEGSYWSVRRFVQQLRSASPLPFRRMEVEPGQEAQVDFGTGAAIITAEGRRRKCYVFRVVLSHSRKAYSEVVDRQTTENFIRALENAFHSFGGVPKSLVIDNLRAAVKKVDWFEPEINPKVRAFCEHYGTAVLPTRPYTPRHKGKVERGIDYVQNNALKGRTFKSLHEQNEYLEKWERTVADKRIHGTTRKHVGKLFEDIEQAALLALPNERFPCFQEARRSVHRDAHVEVAKSYYSVPTEYLRREVWVRWNNHTVRIFNHRLEQIALHARVEAGRFSTHPQHIAAEKISTVERGAEWLLSKVSWIGQQTTRWAQAMIEHRGIEGVRVLHGLLALTKKHSAEELEAACELAWRHQAYQLRTVRILLSRSARKQETFEFLEEHPIIRPLSEYGDFIHQAFQEGITDA